MGESWPAELEASVSRVLHPLSAAARTFKAAALAAAAAAPGAVDGSEIFRSGLVARDSVAADLVPA